MSVPQISHARAAGFRAPRLPGTRAKKRLHSRRAEPMIGQSPNRVVADGRGRRCTICRLGLRRGRRIRRKPGVERSEPREEVRVGSTSTGPIWVRARQSARGGRSCQLCAPCRERAAVLTEKIGPRPGGRAGPETAGYFGSRGEGTDKDMREGTSLSCVSDRARRDWLNGCRCKSAMRILHASIGH